MLEVFFVVTAQESVSNQGSEGFAVGTRGDFQRYEKVIQFFLRATNPRTHDIPAQWLCVQKAAWYLRVPKIPKRKSNAEKSGGVKARYDVNDRRGGQRGAGSEERAARSGGAGCRQACRISGVTTGPNSDTNSARKTREVRSERGW